MSRYSVRHMQMIQCVTLRPDSTTAKFFARNCLREIRMVGHEWFYWILSLFSPSQWVEVNSTHWRSEFFAHEERIQWNYSCATIRISHKQFLVKYFAVVESGLYMLFSDFLLLYAKYNNRNKQSRWHSLCIVWCHTYYLHIQ